MNLNLIRIFSKAFKDLWTNERLLNVVEQLIGPDIAGHPVWNLRTKTPQNEATTVPWHQGTNDEMCMLLNFHERVNFCFIQIIAKL